MGPLMIGVPISPGGETSEHMRRIMNGLWMHAYGIPLRDSDWTF